jgi:glycosyltransferase involved in cell wall biosynthesis
MRTVYHLLDEREVFSESDGGAISRWAANALREGDEVIVCPSYDLSWGFPADRLYKLPRWHLTGPVHPILYRLPWHLQKTICLQVFRPLFERLRPNDVVYVHNRPAYAAVLATVADKLGFRPVLHMHNSLLLRANKGQLAALKNTTIVFCSQFLRTEVQNVMPGHFADTHVVYNGADDQKFHPDPDKANVIPRIIFSGRLVAYKGVHILLEAMRLLSRRRVDAACVIVGGAGFGNSRPTRYVKRLRKARPENTRFAGYLRGSELAKLLRTSDIFCCPSIWHDPFPLAPIEAMASGNAVVASATGGLPETLSFGGGVLIPPNDPLALADALQQLIEDTPRRKRLAAEAVSAFRDNFRWTMARAQYQQVIQSLPA